MPALSTILAHTPHPNAVAIAYALGWVAAADGTVHPDEAEALHAITEGWPDTASTAEALRLASAVTASDAAACCAHLAGMSPEPRDAAMRLAVVLSLEDGTLTTPESLVVRLLADVLGFDKAALNRLFRDVAETDFPPPADLSDPGWWDRADAARAQQSRQTHANAGRSSSAATSTQPDMQRLRDLATLGLDETAAPQQIREAYRRMSQVHHPDKYAALGKDAVQAASASFQRIQAAYERLSAS